jgi:sphingomyelin phosphodiesterase acid-like 3
MVHLKNLILLALCLFSISAVGEIANPNINHFIAIGDIHFTPFSQCQTSDCTKMIEKLQQAPVAQWDSILKKNMHLNHFPSYGQDTNYPLFLSSLDQLHSLTISQHPKFIVYLGDFLGHNYVQEFKLYANPTAGNYQDFVEKSIAYLAQHIRQAAVVSNQDKTPVYFILGNNDSEKGDYIVTPHSIFLRTIANSFEITQANFYEDGYYSISPNQHQRFLFLNTTIFSPLVKASQNSSPYDEAQQELTWFNTQLKIAQLNHQKVFIFMHIPPGIDAFLTQKTNNPLALITISTWKQYITLDFLKMIDHYNASEQNITGIFAAHTHEDEFRMINHQHLPVASIHMIPSISPAHMNNPGITVYDYNASTFQLMNYSVYYLNLSVEEKKWQLEYNFDTAYHLSSINNLLNNEAFLQEKLSKDAVTATLYQQYYTVDDQFSNTLVQKQWPYFYCAIGHLQEADYSDCLKRYKSFLFDIHH